MNWFRNLRLSKKMVIGFGMTICFTLLVGLVAYRGMSAINEQAQVMATRIIPRSITLGEIKATLTDVRNRLSQVAYHPDMKERQTIAGKFEKNVEDLAKEFSDYAAVAVQQADKDQIKALQAASEVQIAFGRDIIKMALAGDVEGSRKLFEGDSRKQFRGDIQENLVKLDKWNKDRAKTRFCTG